MDRTEWTNKKCAAGLICVISACLSLLLLPSFFLNMVGVPLTLLVLLLDLILLGVSGRLFRCMRGFWWGASIVSDIAFGVLWLGGIAVAALSQSAYLFGVLWVVFLVPLSIAVFSLRIFLLVHVCDKRQEMTL